MSDIPDTKLLTSGMYSPLFGPQNPALKCFILQAGDEKGIQALGRPTSPEEGPKDNDRRLSHKVPPTTTTMALQEPPTYLFTNPKQQMSSGS